jgi:hypothetical protein
VDEAMPYSVRLVEAVDQRIEHRPVLMFVTPPYPVAHEVGRLRQPCRVAVHKQRDFYDPAKLALPDPGNRPLPNKWLECRLVSGLIHHDDPAVVTHADQHAVEAEEKFLEGAL